MNAHAFEQRNKSLIKEMAADTRVRAATETWIHAVLPYEYNYHFSWLGVPVIQFPPDVLAMQELVWRIQPDVLIETGVARGGSLIFYASLLRLIGKGGQVVGVDIDIREENREIITRHPLSEGITLIEGSSTDDDVVVRVADVVGDKGVVMVVLDSKHTHEHVLAELHRYSAFVTEGSYIVVFDTIIEDLTVPQNPDRPWGKGNSPKTAVVEFLAENHEFVIDKDIEDKLLITGAPDGFLRRRSVKSKRDYDGESRV